MNGYTPPYIVKAIFAALAAGVAVLITGAQTDGISLYEWLGALGAALATGGGTFSLPNRNQGVPEGRPRPRP